MLCVEAYVQASQLFNVYTTSFIQTYEVTTPLHCYTIEVYLIYEYIEYGIRVI